MHSSRTKNACRARFMVMTLTLLLSVGVVTRASDTKNTKSAPAPAKPAAPAAKPAAAPHPAGNSGASTTHSTSGGGASTTGATTSHPGPTTSNSTGAHTGPTTSSPTANHTGPTTSNPTAGHSGPTTSNPTGTHTSGPTANGPGNGHTSPTSHASIDKPAGTSAGGINGSQTKTPGPVKGPAVGSSNKAIYGSSPASNAGINGRPMPKGAQTQAMKNGDAIQKRPNGKISDVRVSKNGNNMDVHHELNGNRRVSVDRADRSRIVAERGRPGYVQRGYSYHGRDYARRSYYYHGREYSRYYNRYNYHGRYMEVYAPVRYYPPAFYGWAYNPWYQPVYYSWGWGGNPWYGYYGYYFAPAPFYPTAALWLTDYLISNDLAAAYQAQQEAQIQGEAVSAANGAVPITPEVKQQIADEVKNQIALENAEAQQNAQSKDLDPASSGIARLLADGHPHVFVVGGALDVVDATSSTECALSDGDALEMATPPPGDATEANVVVLSSKGGKECRKGSTVAVAVNDLQDMQNHMRDMIDQGLQELQAKQGKGGLPTLPPSAAAPPVEAGYAKDAPPADPKGAEEIAQQLAEADKAEREVTLEAQQQMQSPLPAPSSEVASSPDSKPESTPATIEVKAGQTIDQVKAELGSPLKVIDLGAKKTYVYKDMKVIFKDGKVADVQ